MRMLTAVCFLFLTMFSSIAVAQAATSDRDAIIQNQLNCVDDQRQHSPGVTWNDVCDITEPSPQDHMQAVNQQLDQVENPPAHLKNPEIVYALTPETSYIRYREPSIGVKEQGDMYGINGTFTYRPKEGDYLYSDISDVYRAEARFSYGKVKYIGSLGDGTPFNFSGIDDYMEEVRGLIGKDFTVAKLSTTLTPYWGIGYRSLFDSLRESGPTGYNRWIQYVYLPTGADVMTDLIGGWAIGANVEYDFLIHGGVTSYLGEAGLGDAQNPQRHGFGVKGSFKIVKKWPRFNLTMEPYIRYWHIRNSETTASKPFLYNGQYYVVIGQEPNNNSTEIGARIGIEF
jgi:hypothetical protein